MVLVTADFIYIYMSSELGLVCIAAADLILSELGLATNCGPDFI